MTQLILTPEQADLLSATVGKLPVYLPDGSVAGYLSRPKAERDPPVFTPEEIEAAKRAETSPGPWYSTQQVLDHLRSLDR